MADISILSRLVNGFNRNVDVSQNALIVGSIKIGSSSPVEITKTIAAKLLLINAAADADGTYDSRYTKITDLASTASGKGAGLVGIHDAGSYFTGTTVEEALQELGTALGTGTAAGISYDPSGGDLVATNVQDAIDELDDRVIATEIVANAAIPLAQKGANNGVATLDSGGKIPTSQLPNTVMEYKGNWNASTNSPSLADGTGNAGDVYRANVAGTQNLGSGAQTFAVGDWVVYSGTVWEKSINSNSVGSVNGQTGTVVLTTSDIAEGSNPYFTDERAQDAVGGILTDTATIDLTYDDAGGAISADVKSNSIGKVNLKTDVADQDTIVGGNNVALSVDHSPKIQTPEVAGESLAATTLWALRYAKAADAGFVAGRMYKADIDSSSADNFDVQGLAYPAGSISTGGAIQVVQEGLINVPSHGLTVGLPIWLDASGAVTQTAPSTVVNSAVVKLGTVKDANNINVKIQIMSAG